MFVAQVDTPGFYEALDLVVDKLGRQLSRHKERFGNRRHSTAEAGGPSASRRLIDLPAGKV